MRPSRLYRTEALILRDRKVGEADKILTLYSADRGKFDAIAKGVRRPTSRKSGHLEVLTRVSLLVASGRNLDVITQCETVNSYAPLRDDLQRLSRGVYIAELVDEFTIDCQPNVSIFALTVDALEVLAGGLTLDLVLRRFELELLSLSGYRPELRACASCGGAIVPVINHFSPSAGGVVCPACRIAEATLRPLSVNALKVLRLLQSSPSAAQRLQLSPSLAAEIENHLRLYIRYLLEREPRSRDFMRRLTGAGSERVLS